MTHGQVGAASQFLGVSEGLFIPPKQCMWQWKTVTIDKRYQLRQLQNIMPSRLIGILQNKLLRSAPIANEEKWRVKKRAYLKLQNL